MAVGGGGGRAAPRVGRIGVPAPPPNRGRWYAGAIDASSPHGPSRSTDPTQTSVRPRTWQWGAVGAQWTEQTPPPICALSGPPCRGPKGRGSRCEAARAAIRFGGSVRPDVLKRTIAPGIGPKGTWAQSHCPLCFPPPSPSPPSPGLRPLLYYHPSLSTAACGSVVA